MKTIILCGGRGTRLNEMGSAVPKALVPVGGKPVIWHLMRLYTSFGFNEFVLCLGYLQEKIRDFFLANAVGQTGERLQINYDGLECVVNLFDTGLDTNTGGRIKAVEAHLGADDRIFVTYGDGLADVDLRRLLEFHLKHGKTGTLVAVRPVSNFGILQMENDGTVQEFQEKPVLDEWINGGFFVFEREIFDRLESNSILEKEPLAGLAREGLLMAYRHEGFWKCMDTYKDNLELNKLWDIGAPWKVW
jgi:glucose-1-phosphate cytidylyltransferase